MIIHFLTVINSFLTLHIFFFEGLPALTSSHFSVLCDYSELTGNLHTVSSLVKVYLKRHRFTEPVHPKNDLLNHTKQTDIIEPS